MEESPGADAAGDTGIEAGSTFAATNAPSGAPRRRVRIKAIFKLFALVVLVVVVIVGLALLVQIINNVLTVDGGPGLWPSGSGPASRSSPMEQ